MGRSNKTGLPFLVGRPDSGKYTYHRVLPGDIAASVKGVVELDWAIKPHKLNGKAAIKISLKTGDTDTARTRWASVHAQVQIFVQSAERGVRTSVKDSGKKLAEFVRVSTENNLNLAGQVHHDILAADDETWISPRVLSPVEDVLAMIASSQGKTIIPNKAREFARAVERREAEALYSERDIKSFDQRIEEVALKLGPEALEVVEVQRAGKAVIRNGKPVQTVVVALDPKRPWLEDGKKAGAIPSDVDAILYRNGLDLPADHPDRNKLALEILRQKLSALRIVEDRQRGATTPTPPRPPKVVLAAAVPTISQMRARWIELKKPGQKAIDDNKLYVDRFMEEYGDCPVNKIDRRMIRAYRDKLAKCPRNMPKDIRKSSLDQQIVWAKANPDQPVLSRRTVNAKGIGSISACLAAAIEEEFIESNSCHKTAFALNSSEKRKYRAYNDEDLNKIISSPVYNDQAKRWHAGCGEAAFWMPLIALFSGARLEEIGQLLLSDIKCESRIDYFDLMDLDDGVDEYDEDGKKIKKHKKQLKSENARRQVVIHPVLIDLGFLDYVAELRARKGVRVFPHLTAYRGKLTHNWSKWWARFTDDYVTADPLKVFHSFRHKFIDRMRRLKVEPFVLKALVGHASSDTTDGYGDVCDLSTRRDAIYVLDYPGLDLSHLKRKGVM